MREFLMKTKRHIIPCTLGCLIVGFLLGTSMWFTVIAIPVAIAVSTKLCDELGF